MNSDDRRPECRFGDDFVDHMRKKYGNRSRENRKLTYDIGVLDEFAPWRRWMDEQLSLIAPSQANKLVSRIWLDDKFWPCIFELATGAYLRDLGLTVDYEVSWDGLSPDWTVFSADGKPSCFVEVHTVQPKSGTFAKIRSWQGLEHRVGEIPAPYLVTIDQPGRAIAPPTSEISKRIVRDLRRNLLRPFPDHYIDSHGYRLAVALDEFGQPRASPAGVRAKLITPSGIAGSVSATSALDAVSAKVAKYHRLAVHFDVPLVVAVGSHKFSNITLDMVEDLLMGNQSITFQFSPGDLHIGEGEIVLGLAPRALPDDLSALLWMSNEFPFRGELRVNQAASRIFLPR